MLEENSPADRLDFYRQQAEQALRQATITPDPLIRTGLLNLAAAWHRLIRESEALRPCPPVGQRPSPSARRDEP
jgi:hypothetical protein